jgi:hypothetical protein
VDDLELLSRSRPDVTPSPETVARHRRALADAIGSMASEPYPAPDQPGRRARFAAFTAAALVVTGVAAALLSPGGDDTTRVVTAPPATQAPTSTLSPGTIVPCGSHLPAAITDGPPDHSHDGLDPDSISVRVYACRVERSLPQTLTGPDGQTREMVTTLRELMDRFGGMEGSVLDEFGRPHNISLDPLAGADPDTTAVGLSWSGRRRDAPPPTLPGLPPPSPFPPGLPPAPPTSLNILPPWVQPGRR